jgi:uncharacterized protein YkwD
MDRSLPPLWLCAAALVLFGCSASPRAPGQTPQNLHAKKPAPDPNTERYSWDASTSSPQPLDASRTNEAPCGASDRALYRVAERVAAREALGKSLLDTSEITFALRSAGAPYVWPRAWTLRGEHDAETERVKLEQWLASLAAEGEKRCAVASLRANDGQRIFAAVAVAALADLEPLPTRARVGTWLDLRAVLLVPATAVEVIVLGPRGRPHGVLASLSGTRVRARFRTDREGTWLVQVLATTATGPRVVAEALVAAGSAPPEVFDATPAPGEASDASFATAGDALVAMVNGARASEGLGRLKRDERLDQLAAEQAEAMRNQKSLSHDASGKSLDERVSGLALRSAGENVAHATDVARAHRSLWKSPSHRENMLHPDFELVGVGVAKDDDGSIWVAEIFAK